ncbi:MAG: GAF domain-containing sensor histidine kinase [Bacteroidia bacterium]|nr:GAF domain-containing sensor histidine kinase [Bacteroidia bacterium]NNF32389.1 GAF domain-containing sensor histidine kinase [Flavobacteriaceae bacterium]MBT8275059.1 GAF domain-containing sensor histidine kinase [Bacteroidia bacterium]NNJ81724.1 GAF domain-containing sensor histidine kinase [Flavobacteriaceae bacterium]NNK55410.1 GAF domain-containing sensor histidine kinase [Flavobacteriaceae bacterium]
MITPTIPANEKERLKALRSYDILHSGKEEAYDQLTELAAHITNMPVSLISLVDKDEVWFKSAHGLNITSSSRDLSFCSHAVGQKNHMLVLEDIKNHPEFSDHPYANDSNKPIQFYAGVCLLDDEGHALGTLCVIDNKPNTISDRQIEALQVLAKQVVKLIELNKRNKELHEIQDELKEKNEDLRQFAGRVSHDMKMPLANMIVTADLLKAKYAGEMNEEATKYLNYLKDSSFSLSDYITGMLAHYESDRIAENSYEDFDLDHLLEEIVELLNIDHQCEINFPEIDFELNCNRAALGQIFLNLIGNSLKYNDKDTIIIKIACERTEGMYHFSVSDNGMGIPDDKVDDIFDLFTTVGNLDRRGRKGNGIGLSTVKKLVEKLGGTIDVSSELGVGTTFHFSIKGN